MVWRPYDDGGQISLDDENAEFNHRLSQNNCNKNLDFLSSLIFRMMNKASLAKKRQTLNNHVFS